MEETKSAMHAGQPRPELFFELSADLFCVAGYDGYLKMVNPAVSKLLGYSREELLSRPINSFIHPEDVEITMQYRNTLMKGIPLQHYENRYITQTGDAIWLSWTSMPVEEQQLIYAVAKNISHKKKMENERNALISELTRMNKSLQQLNYTATHDLRSPVNNLLAVFELFEEDKIQDEETRQFIGMLRASANSLRDNLDKYIDLLKDQNNQQVQLTPVNLPEVANKTVQSLTTLIQQTRTRIHLHFESFSYVSFNQAYMESIFLNMISNAIKYARQDITPELHIYTDIFQGQARLHFRDNGLGMDLEKIGHRLFGLNQTFHNHSDSKGIGLYLVYNHVQSLGGRIEVESSPGKGAHFTIYFR